MVYGVWRPKGRREERAERDVSVEVIARNCRMVEAMLRCLEEMTWLYLQIVDQGSDPSLLQLAR